jgi:5-methylcytosine-specific restriction endonuclease McrA
MAVMDPAATIQSVCHALGGEGTAAASGILRAEYPFVPLIRGSRRYTERQSLRVFTRDGFIDRYSGLRLVFPGVLRLLSRLLPREFPFHRNWKIAETHPAYWELFPTIDHVLPITRGGVDSEANWVTTSMLQNAAKANWTLTELGWSLRAPGSLGEWDGLTGFFMEFIDSEKSLLQDAYLRRWHGAVFREREEA